MKSRFIIIFLFYVYGAAAQVYNTGIMENRMLVQSESFRSYSDHTNMIFNISNGDFYLSFDVSTLKTGDAKLDSTLAGLGQQIVVYKGNIGENIFKFNQQVDDEKQYNMPGILSANGVETQCIAQFDPISLADKSDVKNYRMDFKLVVDAGKVTIKGLENKLTKDVVFQVMGGRLNVQP